MGKRGKETGGEKVPIEREEGWTEKKGNGEECRAEEGKDPPPTGLPPPPHPLDQ